MGKFDLMLFLYITLLNKLTFNNTGYRTVDRECFSSRAASMIKRLSTSLVDSEPLLKNNLQGIYGRGILLKTTFSTDSLGLKNNKK